MADEGRATGPAVTLSSDWLKNFADNQVQGLSDDIAGNKAVQAITNFANGLPNAAGPGREPDGTYNQLMAGNTKNGKWAVAQELQSNFTMLAGHLNDAVEGLKEKASQLKINLEDVASVTENAEGGATLTADQMTTLLSNVTPFNGVGGTDAGGGVGGGASGSGSSGGGSGSDSGGGDSGSGSSGGGSGSDSGGGDSGSGSSGGS